jgi:cytochrome P450
MRTQADELYYDPFDVEIDRDPHPVWKRMRDEAPLYYNERYDFYALSRHADVQPALVDWNTYRSGKGAVLEFIKASNEIPSGLFLMEDPPAHDVHRALMARVFTPKRMYALEDRARAFCARCLDPILEGGEGFDFIADLGAQMPMRMIGMLLGIPEADQEILRDELDAAMHVEDGTSLPDPAQQLSDGIGLIVEYIDHRRKNPSDDLMTELLHTEFDDEHGVRRRLRRSEAITYTALLAGAGNETTTRLIGWTGLLLGEHPEQRRAVAEDRSLVQNAIEEVLRYESPSPALARYISRDVDVHGQTMREGSVVVLLASSANRDERAFPDADRFDIHRPISQHVAFGFGIHFCLGAALARLGGRIALDEVLNRWPDWQVDWDHAVQAHTPSVRGWAKLPVVTGRPATSANRSAS